MKDERAVKPINPEGVKSLWIDAELHHELKMRAVETRGSIRQLAEAAIRLYLDGGPAKEGK